MQQTMSGDQQPPGEDTFQSEELKYAINAHRLSVPTHANTHKAIQAESKPLNKLNVASNMQISTADQSTKNDDVVSDVLTKQLKKPQTVH